MGFKKFLKSQIYLLFIIFISIPCRLLHSLDPGKEMYQYVHNVWQIKDGLPQNSVNSIVQDKKGYLWLATLEGIVRFDGANFEVFNRSNTPQMKSNEIRTIFMDEKGVLWVGTYGGGLLRIEDESFVHFGKDEGLKDSRVWAVDGNYHGVLAIGTHNGLFIFKNNEFKHYTMEEGLSGNDIRTLYFDYDNQIWIGTHNGISLFKDGKFKTYTVKDGLSHNKIKSIYRDSKGVLWVGTHKGIDVLKNGEFEHVETGSNHALLDVQSIFEDQHKTLWFGTSKGVYRYVYEKFSVFNEKAGLSHNIVKSFFEDREGSLWIGTVVGGLNRFRDGKFTPYTEYGGMHDELVWSLIEDQSGTLWIASDSGLISFKNDTFKSHLHSKKNISSNVSTLLELKNGIILAGTSGDGVLAFNGKKYIPFYGQNFLKEDYILSMIQMPDSSLFIGTRNGLVHIKDKIIKRYSTKENLAGNVIRNLQFDKSGNLWIGTDTGLSYFDGKKFKTYTTKDGLSSDAVFSLYIDRENTLWIGTYGGGLNRLKNDSFSHATSKDGIFDDVAYSLLEDSSGKLWMSGNKGIYSIKKLDFEKFINKEIDTIPSDAYGTSNGMKTNECNGGLKNAGIKTRDGNMWFATIKGLVTINPDKININNIPPPVHIKYVIVDGKRVPVKDNHIFPASMGKIEFHYAGLSFAVPEKVRFKYKLIGLDEDWVNAGRRTTAYYTTLPYGKYTFKVKAMNNDGIWNETGASISFTKKAYITERREFYLLSLAALLTIVLIIHKIRVRRYKRLQQELQNEVHQHVKRIREAHTEISLQKNDLLKTQGQLKETVHKLLEAEKMASLAMLVAGIAHELNTPVGIGVSVASNLEEKVQNFAELYRNDAMKRNDLEHFLNTIFDSSQLLLRNLERTADLIKSFKQVSVDETSEQKRVFNLKEYIEELIHSIGIGLKGKDIDIELDLQEDIVLDSYPGVFAQILTNFIFNSKIHGFKDRDHGTILIKTEFRKQRLFLFYKDDGVGISENDLNKIFDPFFTTNRQSGTGLGMHVVYNLVNQKLNGSIQCKSKPGQGVTFTINIPLEGVKK